MPRGEYERLTSGQRWTRDAAIRKVYQEEPHVTTEEIARRFRLTSSHIVKIITKGKIERRWRKRLDPATDREIITTFEQRGSMEATAAAVGVSRQRVKGALRRAGMAIPAPGRKKGIKDVVE